MTPGQVFTTMRSVKRRPPASFDRTWKPSPRTAQYRKADKERETSKRDATGAAGFGVLSESLKLRESTEWRQSSSFRWTLAAMAVIFVFAVLALKLKAAQIKVGEGGTASFPDAFSSIGWHFAWAHPQIFLIMIIPSVLVPAIFVWQRTIHLDAFRVRVERGLLEQEEDRLAGQDAISLAQLWAVTQKRLDYYHSIVTAQARTSFRNAQTAMVGGFIITITTAIYVSINAHTYGAIIAGVVGVVGAALSTYIGRTFLRSQETTASHLQRYFSQPLEFSKYLAAERLVALSSPKIRDEIVKSLVESIVDASEPAPKGTERRRPPRRTRKRRDQ